MRLRLRVALPVSCLTDKDRVDLRFGIEQGVDFVAISFVRSAADIAEVRRFLAEHGARLDLTNKQGRTPLDVAILRKAFSGRATPKQRRLIVSRVEFAFLGETGRELTAS